MFGTSKNFYPASIGAATRDPELPADVAGADSICRLLPLWKRRNILRISGGDFRRSLCAIAEKTIAGTSISQAASSPWNPGAELASQMR